jgi:hypothetical protein
MGAFVSINVFSTSPKEGGVHFVSYPVRWRTITYEVGHYLGLRHIWGDGLLSIFGIPDCDADDGVEDIVCRHGRAVTICPAINSSLQRF